MWVYDYVQNIFKVWINTMIFFSLVSWEFFLLFAYIVSKFSTIIAFVERFKNHFLKNYLFSILCFICLGLIMWLF